jgi:hypothetical protein
LFTTRLRPRGTENATLGSDRLIVVHDPDAELVHPQLAGSTTACCTHCGERYPAGDVTAASYHARGGC